jgi:DNA polymerase III subunit epsilon
MSSWKDHTYVAFDTETSGAYPLGADVVEFGAVKWRNGEIIGEYQTLLKPREKMSDFIIGIHGITNEMVADAPTMDQKVSEIAEFLGSSVLMAHHAPFDLGFMAVEFEKYKQVLPTGDLLCTSLLSRKLIKESINHKLQTLIKTLKLPQGAAHRALDDAKACLQVGLECMRRVGDDATLEQISQHMGKQLQWNKYELLANPQPKFKVLVEALLNKKDIDIVYEGGSIKGQSRRITPIGVVRNPDGDYVMAVCHIDRAQKRFYFDKISDLAIVF